MFPGRLSPTRLEWKIDTVEDLSLKEGIDLREEFYENPEVNRIQISRIGLNLKFETFKFWERHDVSEFIGELLMIKVTPIAKFQIRIELSNVLVSSTEKVRNVEVVFELLKELSSSILPNLDHTISTPLKLTISTSGGDASDYLRYSTSVAGAARRPGPTPKADAWDEIVEAMIEITLTNLDRVDKRVTELDTTVRQRTEEDRPYHRHTALSLDREAVYARIAWTGSEERSAAIEAHVKTLEAQVATLITQTTSLQTQLTTALGRIETQEARDPEPQDGPAEAGSSC
ncbi:hypothetical protein Tco_0770135 [Tanacetum coccineum]|uniref:Uncharacterized protein n=1 Tax=Tanacetum coccineum TaxID=301880 RepID=A0ABQ4ZBC1_9ASTR